MTFNYESALIKRRGSSPQGAYLWCVELPKLDDHPIDMSESPSYADAIKTISSNKSFVPGVDMELVNTLVTSFSQPFFSIDTDKVVTGNRFWYAAKHNDISNISLTMEEQQSGIVWQYLNNWRQLIINPLGGYNPPHFYKRDVKVHRLNPAKEIFQTFVYRSCFITEISTVSNDYNSNSPLEYSVSLSVDKFDDPLTLTGSELLSMMEEATRRLEGIDISYNRFGDPSLSRDVQARILTEVGRRAFF